MIGKPPSFAEVRGKIRKRFGDSYKNLSIVSRDQFVAKWPERWRPIDEQILEDRRQPRQFGSAAVDFLSMLEPIPHLGVLILPGGWVCGEQGWAFDSASTLIAETCWHGLAFPEEQLTARISKSRKIKGICLSLVSEYARNNYGHYVLDCLSRIGIVERSGWAIGSVDHIYLYRPPSPTAARLLERLGVRPDQCIWADEQPILEAETLLVTTFPGTKRNYAPIVSQTLRQLVQTQTASGRRLYVPRAGTRKMVNEAEIKPILAKYQIEEYDFRYSESEPEFFSAASLVIGAHGAGLTNIAFCGPGTKILEIVPSDHAYPYFYTLAESGHLDYSYMVGASTDQRPAGAFGPSPYDFEIDLTTFKNAVETLAGELTRSER